MKESSWYEQLRAVLSSGWSSAEIVALSPMRANQCLEPVLITPQSGERSGKHPYPHSREEFPVVVEEHTVAN